MVTIRSRCWDGIWVLWFIVLVWISCDGICVPSFLCDVQLPVPVVGVWLPVGCSGVDGSESCPAEFCAL